MTDLILKTGRDATIIFPAQLPQGELLGYFVPNTNIYNVVPADASIQRDKVHRIGWLLPQNPFTAFPEGLRKRIKAYRMEDTTATAADRIKAALRGEGAPAPFDFSAVDAAVVTRSLVSWAPESAWAWIREVLVPGVLQQTETEEVVGYPAPDGLHFVRLRDLVELKQDGYSLKLDVFSRNTGILESDIMLPKGALFIGCGSVGSLFALELAKAGVGRFFLVDSDILGYHNLCRHQCGMYDVGRYKTEALRDRILQINPYARVITRNMLIQDVPVDELYAFCKEDAIFIGGADNRDGDLYACNVAVQAGVPFMSVGCWERAFAGEIFYCLPQGMPTYYDFLVASGHLSARVNQNRRFYTTEEALEKVSFEPGISADIGFVTLVAVKMALDLLNRDNPHYTQRLVPHLTQYTLVCNTNNPSVGGEMAEIFSYPLQVTTSILVPYAKK